MRSGQNIYDHSPGIRRAFRKSVAYFLLAFLIPGFSTQATAYTPESPQVQSMIKRAVRYLEREDFDNESLRALSALAIFKAGQPKSHPKIQAALKDCKDICRSVSTVDSVLNSVYKASVVGLFLSEVSPDLYKKEIQNVIASLEKRQKPFGGWGYPPPSGNAMYGDTSMTQYAVLCAWTARAVGAAEVSDASIKSVAYWLVRTQDPSGAWGYQGRDPTPTSFTRRVPQEEVRHSLSAAGLGSLYICSGMLGMTPTEGFVQVGDLPPALKRVEVAESATTSRTTVSDKQISKAIRDGDRWYKSNYRINPPEYTLYYLYTLERYQSFKEMAEGRRPAEPSWYNDGVRFLASKQGNRGQWDLDGGTNDVADTAFGIFFLIRSTQKSIRKAQDEFSGVLVAGRGLPGNTEDVRLKQGKIVTTPFQGTAKALLDILSDANHPDFDSVAALEAVALSDDPAEAEQQQARMRRLVGAESFKTRLVAVKSLSKRRNLDNVPALIFALSDPDARVAIAARDGLRFNGRKFNGFGMNDAPSNEERQRAIEQWKAWYLEIRPNAVFMEN